MSTRIAEACDVRYGKQVASIDVRGRSLEFADGQRVVFERLISTLPLNTMLDLCALSAGVAADPHTSVLVLNIGARKGARCPGDHWIYSVDTKNRFHRIGFYHNVDASFLPSEDRQGLASLYVERAFPGGARLNEPSMTEYTQRVIEEIQNLRFHRRRRGDRPDLGGRCLHVVVAAIAVARTRPGVAGNSSDFSSGSICPLEVPGHGRITGRGLGVWTSIDAVAMIIDHDNKFVFVAVPKTASTAMHDALERSLGRRIPHGPEREFHATAIELADRLGERWTQYLRIGFVRNPYERFVSAYWDFRRGRPRRAGDRSLIRGVLS